VYGAFGLQSTELALESGLSNDQIIDFLQNFTPTRLELLVIEIWMR